MDRNELGDGSEEHAMKHMLKVELKRALKSRGMLLSLTIGMIISAVHVVQYQIPEYYRNMERAYEGYPLFSPEYAAQGWIEGNSFHMAGFVYFFLLPLLAMMPFGASYFSDHQNGFLKNLYMRTKRKHYLNAKYVAVFISGGIAVTLPLVFNLLCSLILLPNLIPTPVMARTGISAVQLFSQIYYSKPLLYILIFLMIDFAFAGMYACITLVVSFLSDYKIIVSIMPFFVQLVLHILCSVSGNWDYSSVYLAQSGIGIRGGWILLAYLGIGITATFLIFRYQGEREDVF